MKLNLSKNVVIGIGSLIALLTVGGGAFAISNANKPQVEDKPAEIYSKIVDSNTSNSMPAFPESTKELAKAPDLTSSSSISKSVELVTNSKSSISIAAQSVKKSSSQVTTTKPQMGKITGTVANVFNNGPKIMPIKVCALETGSKKNYCFDTLGKTDEFYEIKAPFGQYYVYSYLPESNIHSNPSFISFYDEATKCLPFDQKANASSAVKNRASCAKQFPKSKPIVLNLKDEKPLQFVRPWGSVIKYSDSVVSR